MTNAKIRVVVIEDSHTMRAHLCETLAADPGFEVIGAAEEGGPGIALCEQLRPDVISLDMAMPRINGLAVTEHVMAHCPAPILIVSASVERGEAFSTFDALQAGAVDVLEKATGDEPAGEWEKLFLSSLKMVSRIKVITHPRLRIAGMGKGSREFLPLAPSHEPQRCEIVAIGASTGGPAAVTQVLRGLPLQSRVPILLVLHIGAAFAPAFAEWLDDQTPHPVVFARDGQPLAELAGKVVMAPADRHLVVKGHCLQLTDERERHSCRPSVDVLFESLAISHGPAAAACLLTGMGRDGADGLRRMRLAGGHTLAQDEATCVVYGMPREAVLLDAAQQVLPIQEIGPALAVLAGV